MSIQIEGEGMFDLVLKKQEEHFVENELLFLFFCLILHSFVKFKVALLNFIIKIMQTSYYKERLTENRKVNSQVFELDQKIKGRCNMLQYLDDIRSNTGEIKH